MAKNESECVAYPALKFTLQGMEGKWGNKSRGRVQAEVED